MAKRLLVLTQKIDKNDPILGFSHGWVERLARTADSVIVICLEKGEANLPGNVRVLSLGKEGGRSRLKYLRNLYSFVIGERGNYDSAFVHMNQEYVLLCGLLWKAMGKRVVMWRNHPHGSLLTRAAVALSDAVMCVSDRSYTARFSKTKLMPAGIDTDAFRRQEGSRSTPKSVLCVGRISPIKHVDVLLRAAEMLRSEGEKFTVSVVGEPSEGSEEYYQKLRTEAVVLEQEGIVTFYDAVPQSEMPELYGSHETYVNLTDAGSFDKTVIVAMSCERVVLFSNKSFEDLVPQDAADSLMFRENDSRDLAEKLSSVFRMSPERRVSIGKSLREGAVRRHGINELIRRLIATI